MLLEDRAAVDRPLDVLGREPVERVPPDFAGVRLVPAVDFDEDRVEADFVDLVLEAGVFCFVATGVRDSLVAPLRSPPQIVPARWRSCGDRGRIAIGTAHPVVHHSRCRRRTSVPSTQKGSP